MRNKKYDFEKIFSLDGIGIDTFSEELEEKLEQLNIERQNRLRIRLSLEEALLRMRDKFGSDAKVRCIIHSRFLNPTLQLELEGEVYNPLRKNESQLGDWSSSLLTAVGLTPQFSYARGTNYLRLTLPGQRINPVLKIMIAIAIGVVLGLLINAATAAQTEEAICTQILDPLYNLWNSVLLAVSGPVIFLMVITTLLNMTAVTEQGGDSWRVVRRYFGFSFLVAIFAVIVGQLFFMPNLVFEVLSDKSGTTLLDDLFSIVPNNIFTPLVEANTPQILVMAFVLGTALIVAGERVETLKKIVFQMNTIGMLLAEWVSRQVPYFASVLISMQIIKSNTILLTGLWKVLLLALVVGLFCIGVSIAYLCIKYQVSPLKVTRKLMGPFAVALKNGSLDASFGLAEHSCVNQFGIEKHYASVSLSQGLVLYMPVNVVGTLMFTVFAASQYDVTVSPNWLIIAMVLAVILFVATPPVPGANLLAYIVIFAQLGITNQALVDAMIFDIIFGIFASAGNQAMLQVELTMQAAFVGLLNFDRLRR